MTDAVVKLPDDAANTGKQVDNESLTVAATTVYRQRTQIAGAAAAEIARVTNAGAATTDYAVTVRTASLGEQADSAASSDTGTFSLTALVKRALQNWTTLLARIPALGSSAGATSVPVSLSTESVSGTITTQNLNLTGTATAGSAVELPMNGAAGLVIQLTGTYTVSGGTSLQGTVDGTTWVTFNGGTTFLSTSGSASSSLSSPATGIFMVSNLAGFTKVRLTTNGAVTGTLTVNMRAAQAPASFSAFNNLALPSGGNTIGALTANQSVNVSQIAGATALAGNGLASTGSLRVSQAADSTGQVALTNATRSASGLIASGARTTTSSTVLGTPNAGGVARVFSLTVSAVSGTTPTMDCVLQESHDGGTTYIDVYHYERITATGNYVSPPLPVNAETLRLAYTIAGTTPSFTFQGDLDKLCGQAPPYRQFFDRTAGLLAGTLNATSSSYRVDSCKVVTMAVTAGAITTTGGTYKLQGSMDGTNWYDLTAGVVAVASSTVQVSASNVLARFVRALVSSAASGQTGTVVGINATA